MTNKNKARALSEDTTFEFNGTEYTVLAGALDDVEVFEMFEDEKYMGAVKRMLGEEEFSAFKDNNRNEAGRVPMQVFSDFVEVMFKELNLGN